MSNVHEATTHGKNRFDLLPAKLRSYRQFIVWRYEDHGEKTLRKVPYNPNTGERASVSNPASWGTLTEAVLAYNAEDYSGIGFMFSKHDRFAGIDLDKCIDLTTAEVEPWAREYMQRVGSYWEISPSGTGFHCIVEMSAPLPTHGRKKGNIEIYESGRYFTLTGNHVAATSLDVVNCTQEVLSLHAEVFGTPEQRTTNPHPAPITNLSDERLLRVATRAKNGEKFTALLKGDTSGYASHSEADLALCTLLAFYCGGDAVRIDRLFRQSGLYREKWNREDYREATIDAALRSVPNVYGTPQENPKVSEAVRVLRTLVASYPWKGVVGTSARLVLTALSQSMEQTGKEEVAADCRSIAEMTGVRFTTVAKTFRRLCGVAKDKHDHVPVCLVRVVDTQITDNDGKASRHASRYRLSEGAILAHTNNTAPQGESECAKIAPLDLTTISHDTFRCRGRGLTRSAGLVLSVLPYRTAEQIVERTHLSLRTVRTALKALKAENLVEKNEESGVWERTCETLDQVAQRRGTAGASDKQRRLHQIQRDMFSAFLSRMRAKKDGTFYKLSNDAPDPTWEGTWKEAA